MSERYDRVVKLLVAAADQPISRRARSRHQYLVVNPASWAEIQNELGNPTDPTDIDKIRMGQTPGTWLLGVDVILDEELHPDLLIMRTEEHF